MKMGFEMGNTFGWEERGETTLARNSQIVLKYKLAIEAFPMDKWVKFKAGIEECIEQVKANNYPTMFAILSIGNLLKELESFGKPSGDAITNV